MKLLGYQYLISWLSEKRQEGCFLTVFFFKLGNVITLIFVILGGFCLFLGEDSKYLFLHYLVS